ncbi:MAG TPA: toll/interleukin-1 receptor domain-containing protein, partial [Ktedonobacteraceae bacterium]
MLSGQKPEKALEIFFSYAQKDERWSKRLETHLSNLRRQGYITEWHRRNISAGEEWASEIDNHLNTADIILLLISPDFMATDYCYSVEMMRALDRHEAGEAQVIP